MLEGDSADMCGKQFHLMLMRGRAEGLACADPGARTPGHGETNFSSDSDSGSESNQKS